MKKRTFWGVLLRVMNHTFLLLCFLKIESKDGNCLRLTSACQVVSLMLLKSDHSGIWDLFNLHINERTTVLLMCYFFGHTTCHGTALKPTNTDAQDVMTCRYTGSPWWLASVDILLLHDEYLLKKKLIPLLLGILLVSNCSEYPCLSLHIYATNSLSIYILNFSTWSEQEVMLFYTLNTKYRNPTPTQPDSHYFSLVGVITMILTAYLEHPSEEGDNWPSRAILA